MSETEALEPTPETSRPEEELADDVQATTRRARFAAWVRRQASQLSSRLPSMPTFRRPSRKSVIVVAGLVVVTAIVWMMTMSTPQWATNAKASVSERFAAFGSEDCMVTAKGEALPTWASSIRGDQEKVAMRYNEAGDLEFQAWGMVPNEKEEEEYVIDETLYFSGACLTKKGVSRKVTALASVSGMTRDGKVKVTTFKVVDYQH